MSALGGVCSWGVSATGGVCSGGGCLLPGGGIPACTKADTPCEQNDKQVQKYYLGHNFVAAGKYASPLEDPITGTFQASSVGLSLDS